MFSRNHKMADKYMIVLTFLLVTFLRGGLGRIEDEFLVNFSFINLFEK